MPKNSKIIIYDDKNILIADLIDTRKKEKYKGEYITTYEYAAIFGDHKIIHSISLKKQLKKIEKIFKYHKERK